MPEDERLVPGVGNGHVATQVLTDTLYVNNVMNGFGETSHRARVRSSVSIDIAISGWEETSNYILDMHNGGLGLSVEYNTNDFFKDLISAMMKF